jgi:hypothetical protein
MGIEYRLRFSAQDAETVAAVLRRLPAVREAPSPDNRFEFQPCVAEQDWPQATAHIEPGGLYFRDNCGGSGPALLGLVVAKLVAAFGAVTIEEL